MIELNAASVLNSDINVSILFRISELYSLYLSIVFCWHSYQAVCGLESSRDPLYFHPNILHMKAEQREMFVLQNHFMAQITPCSEKVAELPFLHTM